MSDLDELRDYYDDTDMSEVIVDTFSGDPVGEDPVDEVLVSTSIRLPKAVMDHVRARVVQGGVPATTSMRQWVVDRLEGTQEEAQGEAVVSVSDLEEFVAARSHRISRLTALLGRIDPVPTRRAGSACASGDLSPDAHARRPSTAGAGGAAPPPGVGPMLSRSAATAVLARGDPAPTRRVAARASPATSGPGATRRRPPDPRPPIPCGTRVAWPFGVARSAGAGRWAVTLR